MRIRVFEDDRMTDWYDPDQSRAWQEHTTTVTRDGRDVVVGRASDLAKGRETLYRPPSGRWVIRRQTVDMVSSDTSRFIGVEEARQWMLRAGYDEVSIATATGPDSAPVRRVTVSMSASELERVDSAAASARLTRSEWIRRRCAEATTDDEH
ncbi:MAG: hypothetical protein R5N72_09290 [Cutibacterium granulosum]|uniref:hypothetical protein n=1 Tax=Cutibacterium granulosum TaxID=33011 RepID=UPI002B23A5F0|nr:hypothetical protein [Cutibacterium granulosum]MEA5659983.1 hypothetical protein [Cutibacterium granulosum]MEA5662221.1 hypothetical protein [Cutibacterium granulosum]